jgi:hypothetical protein
MQKQSIFKICKMCILVDYELEFGVNVLDRLGLILHDRVHDLEDVLAVEGLPQREQLVHHAAKRPDVRLGRVQLLVHHLRAHVVECATVFVVRLGQRVRIARIVQIGYLDKRAKTIQKDVPGKKKQKSSMKTKVINKVLEICPQTLVLCLYELD